MKEEYFEINGIWHFKLINEHGEVETSSCGLPGFASKEAAEESAFGWMLQNGF